jgi:hypothetical protein
MKLSLNEAEHFYSLWWPLLTFANDKLALIENLPRSQGKGHVNPSDAIKLRDALWATPNLFEEFLAANPADLDTDDLEICASWEHRLRGDFTLLKHLSKYSLLMAQDSRVYGVLGLMSSLDEILPYAPPNYIGATIMPYKDRLVIDGLLTMPSILFGGGIRADLKLALRDVEESYGLITALPLTADAANTGITAGNARLLKAFRSYLAGSGLSDKMLQVHVNAVSALAEKLRKGTPPLPLLEVDLPRLREYLAEQPKTLTSFKRFVRFLEETGRGRADRVWKLQEIRQRSE